MSSLSHLKILDFSTLLPAPFGTLLLSDLGAQILRVEAPDRIDLSREIGEKDGDASYLHRYLNRSKKSLALDLKKEPSIDIIKKIIMTYDIVIEQFRPGVMDKLGLGYEDLKQINPNLIYCSLTGYGQTGPYKNRAGHDINYLAIAGISEHSRRIDTCPVPSGIQIADIAGGSMHLVAGLLAAVIHRSETGKGQYIDISITDSVFTLNAIPAANYLGSEIETKPEGYILNGQLFYDYYETSDSRYISIGGLEPKFIKTLCKTLDIQEWVTSALSSNLEKNIKFKNVLSAKIKEKTYEECLSIFNSVDACIEPVLTLAEACHHEQLLDREMIINVDGIKQIGNPIKMSECPPNYLFKGCSLGEHNDLLVTEFGYSEEEIRRFKNKGIFGKM